MRVPVPLTIVLATACALALGCKSGTPSGTVLVDWSTETVMSGPSKRVVQEVSWSVGGGSATLRFATDIGAVKVPTLADAATSVLLTGPRHVGITLVDGNGLDYTARCMTTPGSMASEDPLRFTLGCFVTARPAGEQLFAVDADGDVTMEAVGSPSAAARSPGS